jgi:hypothetical protein
MTSAATSGGTCQDGQRVESDIHIRTFQGGRVRSCCDNERVSDAKRDRAGGTSLKTASRPNSLCASMVWVTMSCAARRDALARQVACGVRW